MKKSSGEQFLLNIKPKYRKNVSLILEEKKKNREASEWVCQAILEKYAREQISLEAKVEQMLHLNANQEQQPVFNGDDLKNLLVALTKGQATQPLEQSVNNISTISEVNTIEHENYQPFPNKNFTSIQDDNIEDDYIPIENQRPKVRKGKNSLLGKLKR